MNLDFLDQVSILVVGDIMLDCYLWGTVRRISPEAPVPVVEVQRESATAGGAANVALNLASVGVRTEVFGLVGDDASGRMVSGLMEQAKVVFDSRLVRPGLPTITKSRVMTQRQQVCRLDREASPDRYELSALELDLLAERAAAHGVVILSDYAKGVISQKVIDRLREVAGARSLFLAMDPKPRRTLDVGGMHLLTPNRKEAVELAGISPEAAGTASLDDLCSTIQGLYYPEHLVITLSEDGLLLASRCGARRHFPTVAREVADVSGAGDTVVAMLTAALAGGVAPAEAVFLANVAAGLVVAKLGTAAVTRAELAAALGRENAEGSR